MNPDRDLVPLVFGESTPDPVRAALSNARAGLPTEGQLARLAARLPLSPGGPGGSGGTGAPPSAPAMSGAPAASAAAQSAPWLFPGAMIGASVVIVIAGAIAAFSPAFQRHSASPSRVPEKDIPSMSVPSRGAAGRDGARGSAVAGGDSGPADFGAGKSGAPMGTGAGKSGAPVEGASRQGSSGSAEGSASAGGPTSGGGAASAGGAAISGSGGAPTSPKAGSQPLPGESVLLQRAKDALANDPARALAIVEQHRRLYPKGMLAQEREVLAVKALVASGREAEAKKRAGAFVDAYPDSAYRPRVEPAAPPTGR